MNVFIALKGSHFLFYQHVCGQVDNFFQNQIITHPFVYLLIVMEDRRKHIAKLSKKIHLAGSIM